MRLDARTIQWAARRKISAETLRTMSVGGDLIQFGDRKLPAITFNYLDASGQTVNWKARPLNEKDYCQKRGGTQQFFNQAAVLNGPLEEVYVTEGEMDALFSAWLVAHRPRLQKTPPAPSVTNILGRPWRLG